MTDGMVLDTELKCSHQEFACKSRLTSHYKTLPKARPFSCPYCYKVFSSKGNCKTHIRIHTKERPYRCHFCDKRFSQQGQMVIHVRSHTGEKPYVCPYCKKGFTCSKVLKIHIRTHTGEKPYICDFCTKRFAAYANLVVHRRIHTRERPYICKLCGRAFEHSGNLVRHERGHHVDGGLRCIPCGKLFAKDRDLSDHMSSSHPYDIHTLDVEKGQSLELKSPKILSPENSKTLMLLNKNEAKVDISPSPLGTSLSFPSDNANGSSVQVANITQNYTHMHYNDALVNRENCSVPLNLIKHQSEIKIGSDNMLSEATLATKHAGDGNISQPCCAYKNKNSDICDDNHRNIKFERLSVEKQFVPSVTKAFQHANSSASYTDSSGEPLARTNDILDPDISEHGNHDGTRQSIPENGAFNSDPLDLSKNTSKVNVEIKYRSLLNPKDTVGSQDDFNQNTAGNYSTFLSERETIVKDECSMPSANSKVSILNPNEDEISVTPASVIHSSFYCFPGPDKVSNPNKNIEQVLPGKKRKMIPVSFFVDIRECIRKSVLTIMPPEESKKSFKKNVESAVHALFGITALSCLGYPEKNVEQVLITLLDTVGMLPCADVRVNEHERLVMNMRKLLEYAFPERDAWLQFGWSRLSIEEVTRQIVIYTHGNVSRDENCRETEARIVKERKLIQNTSRVS